MAIISFVPAKKQLKDYRSSGGSYYVAKCELCGEEFYPKRSSAKYCSLACMQKSQTDKHKGKPNKSKNKDKEIKQDIETPILVGTRSEIANYFTQYRLKSYVSRVIKTYKKGDDFIPAFIDDDGKAKYKILDNYTVKKVSAYKFELYNN